MYAAGGSNLWSVKSYIGVPRKYSENKKGANVVVGHPVETMFLSYVRTIYI